MQDKLEPRFNPDSIRESVRSPMSDNDDRMGAVDVSNTKPKGSGVLLNLVLLILVIALGGLGWLLLEQKQLLQTTQQQVERLESLVQSRSEGDVVIEATLMNQVDQLQTTQADAQQALGRDLTQLREAIAKEATDRQALQQLVQQLQQSVSAQDTRIQSIQDRPQPADQSSSIENLSTSLRQLQTELSQLKETRNNDGQGEVLQRLRTDLNTLTEGQQQQAQNVTRLTETLTEQRNQLQSVERQLTSRFERIQADMARATEAPSATSSSSELAVIELGLAELREDIRAINNARQLINRDLLQLREQLNRVQLMLN
ncbi:hypothetical protein [Nitrincola schmidtii]|uniref:hypothetical protein n=1 Tax=Nitrincola schmidtii TaxID=1730894 RepID=UPI00124DFDA6|nr:hypothetical protein [Nitrincola schmidtii]